MDNQPASMSKETTHSYREANFSLNTLLNQNKALADLYLELSGLGFSTDIETIQAKLLQGASQILNAQACSLILPDETQEDWMIRKSLGADEGWVYEVNTREGKGLVKECLRSGKAILANNISNDPRYDPSSDGFSGLEAQSLICAPVQIGDQVLGVIQALNKRGADFNDSDQNLISIISALAANTMLGARKTQLLDKVSADLLANQRDYLHTLNTLEALFNHLPLAVYIIDRDYTLISVNKNRAIQSGKSSQPLIGKKCYLALFDRTVPCPECQVSVTFQSLESTFRNERRWGSDGQIVEWEINSFPIEDDKNRAECVILLEQDVSEQRHLESILTQSEKLAAIGQLAAGIAHEINNPLTAIIANAQILHRELPPNDELQESVDLISRAGARATQVVRNLLDFARKEEYHLGLTDLNETLENAVQLVQHELVARSLQLEFQPDPKLPPIYASSDHLQGVWLNLLLNAIDALEIHSHTDSQGVIKISINQMNDEFHISIIDNGKGIPPEQLTRIFDPFYTTKAPGRGTGLGLSVSYRIIKQHGGHIRVESQIGVGSAFTVILPNS